MHSFRSPPPDIVAYHLWSWSPVESFSKQKHLCFVRRKMVIQTPSFSFKPRCRKPPYRFNVLNACWTALSWFSRKVVLLSSSNSLLPISEVVWDWILFISTLQRFLCTESKFSLYVVLVLRLKGLSNNLFKFMHLSTWFVLVKFRRESERCISKPCNFDERIAQPL